MHQVQPRILALSLPPKVTEELGRPDLLRKHSLYLELPYMLAPLFKQISASELEDLQLHSYLYFRFLLAVDDILDSVGKPDADKAGRIFSMFAYYEHSVRGLAQLFPLGNEFWQQFEHCKNLYMAANVTEKKLSASRPAHFDESLFEELASGKSAVCFALVHALSILGNDKAPVPALLQCLQHLHIGLQCIDDVLDFVSDWHEQQYTYAHALVASNLLAQHLDPTALPIGELHQYFYTTNVADEVLARGHRHFELSRTIAQELGLARLAEHLQGQMARCSTYRLESSLLLRKSLVLATKSKSHLHASSIRPQRTTLRLAHKLAEKHLQTSRNAQGAWADFMTSSGESRLWATAFAGYQLATHKAGQEMALEAFNACFGLPKGADESFLQEVDALTFYMGLRRRVWGETDSQEVTAWLAFQQDNGGWVSYRDEQLIRQCLRLDCAANVEGWLTPKCCVTAAAALVLSGYRDLAAEYEASCAYLAAEQQADGRWPSYWWTSDVYATAYAVMALSGHDAYHDECYRAQTWLRDQQASSGAWLDPISQQPCAFYTALALQALQATGEFINSVSIEQGISWLLSHQMTDGSWLPSRVLRVPATDVLDPATVSAWRPSSFGTSIVVDDHQRVFSTSAVLSALGAYANSSSLQLQ